MGDVRDDVGGDGEWGHGIAVVAGADRLTLLDVTISNCWGDGIHVSGGVVQTVIEDCVSDSNRRQGLSIVDAVRPLIRGGRYSATGRFGHTSPAAGIDIEPNGGSQVLGARIEGVSLHRQPWGRG